MAKRLTGDPETDRLMREAEALEKGRKFEEEDDGPPVTTFLEYQQRATMYNSYQDLTNPTLGITAAAGRLAIAAMRQKSSTPVTEEDIARDLAHVLYYLSSLCDQNEVTLQKVAEISLNQLKQHQRKKISK